MNEIQELITSMLGTGRPQRELRTDIGGKKNSVVVLGKVKYILTI